MGLESVLRTAQEKAAKLVANANQNEALLQNLRHDLAAERAAREKAERERDEARAKQTYLTGVSPFMFPEAKPFPRPSVVADAAATRLIGGIEMVPLYAAHEWKVLADQRGTDLAAARAGMTRATEELAESGRRNQEANKRIAELEAAGAKTARWHEFREVATVGLGQWSVREIPAVDGLGNNRPALVVCLEAFTREQLRAAKAQNDLASESARADAEKARADKAEGETKTWQARHENAQENCDTAVRCAHEAQSEVTRLTAEVERMGGLYVVADRARGDLTREVERLTGELAEAKAETKRLLGRVGELHGERNAARHEVDEVIEQVRAEQADDARPPEPAAPVPGYPLEGFVRQPLGTDPERDEKVKAAWQGKSPAPVEPPARSELFNRLDPDCSYDTEDDFVHDLLEQCDAFRTILGEDLPVVVSRSYLLNNLQRKPKAQPQPPAVPVARVERVEQVEIGSDTLYPTAINHYERYFNRIARRVRTLESTLNQVIALVSAGARKGE